MKQLTTYKWFLLVVAFFATTFTYAQKYTGLTATTSGGLTPAQIFDGNTTDRAGKMEHKTWTMLG